MPDRKARLPLIAALLVAAAGLIVFLERFTLGFYSPVRDSLLDFGHLPLFGTLAVIILWLVRLSFGKRIGTFQQYALAWIATVAIGGLSEYMQIGTHRDADLVDWLFDVIGATTFLAFHFTVDPRLSAGGKKLQSRHKLALRVAALSVVAAAAIPLLISCAAQTRRWAIFPKLHTFDSSLERKFLDTAYADLEIVPAPARWKGRSARVARVTFLPARYSTLYFNGPFPDWRGYGALRLDVFSPAGDAVDLNICIRDRISATYNERYNGRLQIRPGYNRVEIPLSEIEDAPAARRLDLSSIREVFVFVVEPEQPLVLYFGELALE